MTGRKDAFAELNEAVTGQVRFGDGSKVEIRGKGSLMFGCKNGEQLLVPDVYYIPALTSNILSLGQLTENGYDVWMHEEFLRVFDIHKRLVMRVQRSPNRLYKIVLKLAKPICLKASLDEEAWTWHARLGHANFHVVETMAKKKLVRGLPCISHPEQLCEACLVAKQTRKSFPKEAQWRATKPLELLHADLCGPITPQTWGGNRYFLLIVDDFSRYMWVYLLKTKNEAFEKFKIFKTRVEKESKYKIKMLRTDRGGEFNSQVFIDFCNETGIKRQTTAPYTPQQNGVVERRNRTVLGMTRSMLKSMNVPEPLWGEAVRHAVYLLNRIVTKAVKNKTPYEAWKKKKPNLKYLKVFGCVGYAMKLTGRFHKLEDRSQPLIYLGREPGSKAYRLFNPTEKRIVVSRDVSFYEKKAWVWQKVQVNNAPSTWTSVQAGNMEHGDNACEDAERVPPTPTFNNMTSPIHDNACTPHANSGKNTPKNENVGTSSNSSTDFTAPYDDSPFQGFRSVDELYEETTPMNEQEVQDMYERDELLLLNDEPSSYKEASSEESWRKAMQAELESIEKNRTWTLTQLPSNQKAIGLKWVFKLKKDAHGNVTKHKARLVAKGYVQQKGVDFEDAFAPVARMETVRLIIAIAASKGWPVHHLDVKSAFLNGDLQEEVYVVQPEGFKVKGKEHLVYKLHKALYGLRQAPRAWNSKLDKTLKELGFNKCVHEQAVYTLNKSGSQLIVGVYVDDIIVTGSKISDVDKFKEKMKTLFDMSDLGLLSYYLGIEVQQNDKGITLKQSAYAKKILKLAGMADCNAAQYPMENKLQLTKEGEGAEVDPTHYRRLIGSLRYLLHTRPDLCYSVGVVSRYMENPKQSHLTAVKHIIRYIKGTIHNGLKYQAGGDGRLVGYSDSSFGTDVEDRRGTSGTVFYFANNVITWSSQKQRTVALSSCEAEFMAATTAACQALWLRNLLSEVSGSESQCVELMVDNEGAIALMKNPVFHGRSKHIDTKYHFIRECVERGLIVVKHVNGNLQKADIFTKSLPRLKFAEMKSLIGVKECEELCPHQGENIG
ncbi:putative RNA-directed DNA polymerase [Helianthus annuus]|nr:putative RNA-directed DNA polymerase [Helianthus annuus]KAJ0906331.1 putative RNA-directed DNA polymerase [Helianthus annuus]